MNIINFPLSFRYSLLSIDWILCSVLPIACPISEAYMDSLIPCTMTMSYPLVVCTGMRMIMTTCRIHTSLSRSISQQRIYLTRFGLEIKYFGSQKAAIIIIIDSLFVRCCGGAVTARATILPARLMSSRNWSSSRSSISCLPIGPDLLLLTRFLHAFRGLVHHALILVSTFSSQITSQRNPNCWPCHLILRLEILLLLSTAIYCLLLLHMVLLGSSRCCGWPG